jgi:tRNA isopentenyl-2-thiomethyl-A-37 hydroxylase MiaE
MCNLITYNTITNFINNLPTKDNNIIDYSISRFFNDYLILGKTQFSEHDIEEIIQDYHKIQLFTNPS